MTGIPTSMLQDGLHPTDQGYDDMSQIWYEGLVEADAKGWIGEPVVTNVTSAVSSSATATIKLVTSVLPTATSILPSATVAAKSGAAMSGAGVIKGKRLVAGLAAGASVALTI